MRVLTVLLMIIMMACAQQEQKVDEQTFGAEITMTQSVTLAEIYMNSAEYEGKEILVEGEITEVCQKKGCWLKMTDGKNELTVKFKDYGFFVPKDAANSHVTIQGVFETKADEHIEKETHEQNEGEHQEEHDPTPYSLTASAVVITPAQDG